MILLGTWHRGFGWGRLQQKSPFSCFIPKSKGLKCPQSAMPLVSDNKLLYKEWLSWITTGNSKYESFVLFFVWWILLREMVERKEDCFTGFWEVLFSDELCSISEEPLLTHTAVIASSWYHFAATLLWAGSLCLCHAGASGLPVLLALKQVETLCSNGCFLLWERLVSRCHYYSTNWDHSESPTCVYFWLFLVGWTALTIMCSSYCL